MGNNLILCFRYNHKILSIKFVFLKYLLYNDFAIYISASVKS